MSSFNNLKKLLDIINDELIEVETFKKCSVCLRETKKRFKGIPICDEYCGAQLKTYKPWMFTQ